MPQPEPEFAAGVRAWVSSFSDVHPSLHLLQTYDDCIPAGYAPLEALHAIRFGEGEAALYPHWAAANPAAAAAVEAAATAAAPPPAPPQPPLPTPAREAREPAAAATDLYGGMPQEDVVYYDDDDDDRHDHSWDDDRDRPEDLVDLLDL